MPQLDIFSYPTQIFWVLLSLSILYIILTKFVLPDLLYILRMRAFRSGTLIKFRRSDRMYRFRNVPSSLKPLSGLEEAFQTNTSLKNETSRLTSGLAKQFNQQRLGLISLVKSIDTVTPRKPIIRDFTQSQHVGAEHFKFAPFLVFFAPTDEFILTISFFFFFVLFYYFVSPSIVNLMIAPQINELTISFSKAVELRRQNLLLKQIKYRNKKTTYHKLFRVLLLYNTLYTSLVLATKDTLKLDDITSILSANKSQTSLEENATQFAFFFQPSSAFVDELDYNNLRLVYFVCEHVDKIQDPFTILDQLLPE